ncbi:MAG TPA: GAF domain-containing protein [Actinospica sp.]|nr:GAF domain-containing protein [Actinospica sp.]
MEIIREHTSFPQDGIDLVEVGATERPTEILPDYRHAGDGLEDVLRRILDGALELACADLGNVQLFDPASGGLRIAAHAGFGPDFLDHFALVTDDDSACGRAARVRAQTVITDVDRDEDFAAHRAVAAASGFRAVASTPLVDADGALVGMVSTHFRNPTRPAEHSLRPLRVFGRLAGDLVARARVHGAPRSGEALGRAAEGAVNRIFAASLVLAGAQAAASNRVWRERLEAAVDELDVAVREIRAAAFRG